MSSSASESSESVGTETSDWLEENLHNDTEDEDIFVCNSLLNAYENQPLAIPGQAVSNDEQDADGISTILESRFDVTCQLINGIKLFC